MTTQNKNIPALRFPEFNGTWEEKRFGELVTNKSEKYNSENEKVSYNCIELEHLATETGNLLGFIDSCNAGSIKNKFEKGDVLFGKLRPYLKKYLQAPFDGVCSSEIWVLKGKNISNNFLYRFIQTDNFIELANQSTGSKMPRADWSVVSSSNIFVPTLSEQQKIAAFLTAVDEKIQQLTKKKDLLEQYKKGVMQKIFNQEIRFKDDNGIDFADWELTELKEIAVRVKDKNRSNEINKVLTNSATKGIVSQQDYFDKDIANQNNLEGYYIVEKDDFVYNPRISTFAPVGPIKRNNLDTGLMSPLYSVFRFNDVNLDFIEQFFETRLWHDYLKSIANYGARHDRMNITVEGFFDMPILLPTKPEQEKIANFLSAIDDKINLVNQQLEKTKEYKKGLLQQMFI